VRRRCAASERSVNADYIRSESRRAHAAQRTPTIVTIPAKVVLAVALLAVSAAVWISVAYRRDLATARERIAAGSHLAATRFGPIEYALAGTGPPVLFIHGAGGGFDQGLEFGRRLSDDGFQVISMSRFGYLRTPLPSDAGAAAQADAHANLLDALGIERAAIVGGSAGAPSAMQFALRYPARTSALVLVVPAAYVPRPSGAPSLRAPAGVQFLFETALRSDFVFWTATRVARGTLTRAILATPATVVENASAEEQARVADMLDHILPVSPRRLGLLNDASITSSIERYDLERISVPTLVLSVADDLFGTFDVGRYTAAHIPGARFVGYPTGGHVWVGHHQVLMDEIKAFLRERPP
jgi:2-hydroxy-6-oxonona-2,4-dienedioate hydrolase